MKNNIIFWALLLVLVVLGLFFTNIASACLMIDWRLTLNIGDLNVNIDKLEEICTPRTCTASEDFITIRSHYDERVAVIIGKTSSILGFKGITIRLPYDSDERGIPVVSEIDPGKYNWKKSVKTDLNFLKETGVLKMEGSEIEKILDLATDGKNILYCKDNWRVLDSNCKCDEKGEELCVRCTGAPALKTFLPQKLLTLGIPIGKAGPGYLYYLIVLIIVLVVIFLVAFLRNQLRKKR